MDFLRCSLYKEIKMKKQCLEILAAIAVKAIKQANNSASRYWSYEPKPPEGLRSFNK